MADTPVSMTLSAEVAEAVRLRDAATPGTWAVDCICPSAVRAGDQSSNSVHIASCYGRPDSNAALIAAAPQLVDLIERLHAELEQARTEFIAAVDAEPELPGDMPDAMWLSIHDDRDAATEAMRIVARQTKRGIKARLSEKPHAED